MENKEYITKTAICITIPKSIKWDDYKKEIDAVADWSQEMNFKVNNLPTKVKPGDRVMYDKYAGTSIKIDGEDHLILKAADIIATIE